MTTSLKDVSSAQMIYALAEMNCFEQECTVYGFAWRDSGRKKWFTTGEDAGVIQCAAEQKLLQGYALSPIQKKTVRVVLSEETKTDILFSLKLELSEKLRVTFDDVYFEALESILSLPADSAADPILRDWQAEIDGYYDADEMQLFDGAVTYAFMSRHLKKVQYQTYKRWCQDCYQQISQQIVMKDRYERTFYGFAYEKSPQQYGYVCNANKNVIAERIQELGGRGCFHTPILEKTYWYASSGNLKDIRKRFDEDLKRLMNRAYLARMKTLHQLPCVVKEESWEQAWAMVKQKCLEEALMGFSFWGEFLNMIK